MNVRELMAKRAALLSQADTIVKAALDTGRAMTSDETTQADQLMADAEALKGTIERATRSADLQADLQRTSGGAPIDPNEGGERGYGAQRARDLVRATAQFVRSGDVGPLMDLHATSNDTEMNVTTAADGGVTVPTGHYNQIIAKREEGALFGPLGVMPIPGIGTTVDVPYEASGANEFVQTDEYTTDDDRDAPDLDKVQMTLVDFAKDIELTNDLLADTDTNLLAYLENWVGRALAKTHNKALITEALANGTSVALAAAAAGTAGDPETIEFSLAGEYADNAAYVMSRATHGRYAKITGSPFLYQQTPAGTRREFNNYPIFYSSYVPATGAGNKSLIFGNFNYMGMREGTLAFLRNPYLKAKKRIVILHYYARIVYKVLNAEAILYGTNPTSEASDMRFNVIGHITSEIGLGIMAADLIVALAEAGHDVIGFDVDPQLDRQNRSVTLRKYLRQIPQMYRDGVDVAVFPINVADHWSVAYRFGTRHVAVPLWELPDANPRWLAPLKRFDGIVSSSDFIYETLTRAGVDVWRGQHPHYVGQPQADRAAFNLPDDRVVFLFAFDPSSDVQRKNPMAIAAAFNLAAAPNALLVFQINRSADRKPEFEQWLKAVRDQPNVRVIEEHLSHADALKLIASSDVYISLHRAEGLGLGMLEAMQLGKPVIATGWSGNMSFMDRDSAALVDYGLRPVQGHIPAYTATEIGTPSRWADPSVEHAAALIKRLAGDASYRADLGQRGLIKAQQHQAVARQMDWIKRLPTPEAIAVRQASQARLMIFTPTWTQADGADAAHPLDAMEPECRASIEANLRTLRADGVCVEWIIGRDNPYPIGDHRNVLHQYQQARTTFLAGPYDSLLTIEHDNVLPDDQAIQRLLDTAGDVIYAPYLLRHGTPLLSAWQYINSRNLGMSLSNYPQELRQARRAVIWKVCGAGMGCTLFRRKVIAAIEFRSTAPNNPCPDLGFAEAALRAGFESYGRFDVPVGHVINGMVVNPYREAQKMIYKARQTTNAMANGRFVRLVIGREIELTPAEAAELTRIGLIAEIPQPAAAPIEPEVKHPIVDANDGVSQIELSEAGRVLHEAAQVSRPEKAAVTAAAKRKSAPKHKSTN